MLKLLLGRGAALATLTLFALPLAGLRAQNAVPAAIPRRADPVRRLDVGKGKIELPAKRLLASATPPPPADPANPHVDPGKVKWHKSFAEASVAAALSKKPVLLFQMLGKLDDQFC